MSTFLLVHGRGIPVRPGAPVISAILYSLVIRRLVFCNAFVLRHRTCLMMVYPRTESTYSITPPVKVVCPGSPE